MSGEQKLEFKEVTQGQSYSLPPGAKVVKVELLENNRIKIFYTLDSGKKLLLD